MRKASETGWAAVLFMVLATSIVAAATPPTQVHYQGVLRDAAGVPLDGDYDMVFRFFDADVGGNEILVDDHTAAGGSAVTVSGGLLGVALGSGMVADGAGPGVYASLAEVFSAHGDVWLEIEINTETMTPRMQVLSAPYAQNTASLDGRPAGEFIDTSTGLQAKEGRLSVGTTTPTGSMYGLQAYGSLGAAYFADSDDSAVAHVAVGDIGITGQGNHAGGHFSDADHSGNAYVGYANRGIQASGTSMGGYFTDTDNGSYAQVAYGSRGIWAVGATNGGHFFDQDNSGEAQVAAGNYGISAAGDTAGGYFEDLNSSGYAYVGYGNYGLQGFSNFVGVYGKGDIRGGQFEDANSSSYAMVGYGSYKIYGSGAVSFVQNHPEESDRVVVYHAPESSEVAVYTRGSARLMGGRARIDLDPSFRWVANPDLGLTAHLTETAESEGLYVESLSSSELIVREKNGGSSNASFDYLVYGLRIGFEELSPVQPKQREAYIPDMGDHRAYYEQDEALRQYNALERFRAMESSVRGAESIDTAASEALIAKIGRYDPDTHVLPAGPGRLRRGTEADEVEEVGAVTNPAPVRVIAAAETSSNEQPVAIETSEDPAFAFAMFPVTGEVEQGDLLSLDPTADGALRVASSMSDPMVIGVALGSPERRDGNTRVAVGADGFATLRVDAGYGAIRPGDLLTASPTPGHAMRALEPLPGTIVGKAMEPLEDGTGAIRVLVMPR